MTIYYYTTFSRENISVFYFADVPIVSLQFGTILKPHSIKEGDDIYFECIVKARPLATSIQWFQNVSLSKFITYLWGHKYLAFNHNYLLNKILDKIKQNESHRVSERVMISTLSVL